MKCAHCGEAQDAESQASAVLSVNDAMEQSADWKVKAAGYTVVSTWPVCSDCAQETSRSLDMERPLKRHLLTCIKCDKLTNDAMLQVITKQPTSGWQASVCLLCASWLRSEWFGMQTDA